MLSNPSYNEVTVTNNNTITVNPNLGSTQNPNKRGCCQTKRRNYSLLTSSNGIDNSTEKSCCSKENEDYSSSDKNCCTKEKQNKATIPKIKTRKENKYSNTQISTIKKEFENQVKNGTIRLNEFIEIFERGSSISYLEYEENQVKAKLINPNFKLDVVSRINENTNSINVNIIDLNKGKKYLDQTFNFKDSEKNNKKI